MSRAHRRVDNLELQYFLSRIDFSEFCQARVLIAAVVGEGRGAFAEGFKLFAHEGADRALDDERHQLIGRVIAARPLAGKGIEANCNAVGRVFVLDGLVFQQPFVDRAQLPDREVAEIDTYAPAVLFGAGKPIQQRRKIRIGQRGPVKQRRSVSLVGKEAAIVWRHADILIAFVDGAKKFGAIVGEGFPFTAENGSRVDAFSDFVAQARQPAISRITLWQEVAVFRVKREKKAVQQRQRRFPNFPEIRAVRHGGLFGVGTCKRTQEVRKHLTEYNIDQTFANATFPVAAFIERELMK